MVHGQSESKLLTRWLLFVGVGALLLRLWIAQTFPITGDEAFFYWWGVYPDWGYYDHPPMVGWLIAAMRATLGDSLWSIRLPVVLLPLGIGAALWWALKGIDKTRAAWAVALFWLAPINWLNTLITTDTPLIFFSVMSACALMRAERRPTNGLQSDRPAYGFYALSGAFLGAAFLSKYFAVVLGLTYIVYFSLYRRDRLAAFVLLVVCSLPFAAINLGYNVTHGWSNIMFNVYNRNEGAVFEWHKPLLYVGMMANLITPPALWMAFKHRKTWVSASTSTTHRLLACLVVVPLLFFLALSGKKVIGLHWVLSFYPFGFALLAFALPVEKLKTAALGMAVFVGLHVAVVAALYMTDLNTWRTVAPLSKIYPQVVRSYKTKELLQQIDRPNVVLMADAYTAASIYGFTRRQYVPVFGVGRFHARQDDVLVDFSVYQGKTIRIITGAAPEVSEFVPYFASLSTRTVMQDGVAFYVVEGVGFNYLAYRQGVLGEIFKRWYNIPKWLPMTGCPFCERYCGTVRCP